MSAALPSAEKGGGTMQIIDTLNAFEIAAVMISVALTAALCVAGLWCLFGPRQHEDGYQSPTIRDNVRRLK